MTGGGFRATASKRLVRAMGIVVALVLAVPMADAAVCAIAPDEPPDEGAVSPSSTDVLRAGSAEDVLVRIEQWAGAVVDGADAPPWFRDEVGFPPGARDVRVGGDGCVVGYALDGDSGDAASLLEGHMAARGWTCVPLGGVDGATYLKESGACTWVLVTCTGVGDSTAVVTRRTPS